MSSTDFSRLNALAAEIGEVELVKMIQDYTNYLNEKKEGIRPSIAPWAPKKSRRPTETSPRPEFQEPLPSSRTNSLNEFRLFQTQLNFDSVF
jgi:hypothetical protein